MTPRRLLPLLVVAGLLLVACAEASPPGSPREPLPEELLVLPPEPVQLHELQSALDQRFGNSPDLGSTEISLDRTVFTVRWFGEPPAELRSLLDAYRDAPFEVRLEGTRFRQGDLMTEAERLLREHPGIVTVTGARNEGDGVIVGIDPEMIGSPDRADLAAYGITSRFPLFPRAESQPVPASG